MRRESRRRTARAGCAALVAIAAAGCGSSPITAPRLEAAIAPTFANLVQVQASWLGLQPMPASEFPVTASCHTVTPGTRQGAGEWVCSLTWHGPDRQTLRDTFDLFVTTDGCYMATAAGDALGGPVLQARGGTRVRNLLYAFEGCFDTT